MYNLNGPNYGWNLANVQKRIFAPKIWIQMSKQKDAWDIDKKEVIFFKSFFLTTLGR